MSSPNRQNNSLPHVKQEEETEEQFVALGLNYHLHPLIADLNYDLRVESPYDPLKFIGKWVEKKAKLLEEFDDSDDDINQTLESGKTNLHCDRTHSQGMSRLDKLSRRSKIQSSRNLSGSRVPSKERELRNSRHSDESARVKANSPNAKRGKITRYNGPKRRNAVFFPDEDDSSQKKPPQKSKNGKLKPLITVEESSQQCQDSRVIEKTEEAISRIMISLKGDHFFRDLSMDQLSATVDQSQVLKLETGQVLLGHGQQVDYFYVVLSGSVAARKPSKAHLNFELSEYTSRQSTVHNGGLISPANSIKKESQSPVRIQEESDLYQSVDQNKGASFNRASQQRVERTCSSNKVNHLTRNNTSVIRNYYQGEVFCHQAFINSYQFSEMEYSCSDQETLVCRILGSSINRMIRSANRKKYRFFLTCLLSKEEFSYLSSEEIDKVVSCFGSIKDIPEGKIFLKSRNEQMFRNAQSSLTNHSESQFDKGGVMYLVLEGEFAKCKKNLNGEMLAYKTLRKGDFFGEEALLKGGQPDYVVQCKQENSELGYLERLSLERSIGSYQKIVRRAKKQQSHFVG